MKLMRLLLIIIFLLLFFSLNVGAKQPVSHDFAYGYILSTKGTKGIYSVTLPDEVYRTVHRTDLGDIRIFNESWEPVPHGLREIEDEPIGSMRDIAYFPLYKTVAGQYDLSFSVKRDNDGTLIKLTDSSQDQHGPGTLSGYLFDLEKESGATGYLELFWESDNRSTTSTVKLEQSDDLQRWSRLVRQAKLVDLRYGGKQVVQRKIHLQRGSKRYVRLSWINGSQAFSLQKIKAVSRPPVSARKMRWVSLRNAKGNNAGDDASVYFNSPYHHPVTSLRLRFTEPNAIVKAAILSAPEEDEQWREQCRKVFYSLRVESDLLQSEPCLIRKTIDSRWRLDLLDDGHGLPEKRENMVLDLGWRPHDLLFLAKGSGPFTLAFGSGRLEHQNSDEERMMVLSALKERGRRLLGSASIGRRIVLGGEAALVPPLPPTPWKKWLLWGTLFAGVALMALMALRLVRELQDQESGTK